MRSLSTRLQFGEFLLDPDLRTLRREDEPVALTGKAFDLLAYMAANPGRPLLKEELLKAVWPGSFVEESNLSQNIFVIRKALGPAGEGTIQTLPGRGYLFTAQVAEVGPPLSAPMLPPGLALEATETRIVFEEDTEEHVPFWRSPVTLGFASAALVLLGVAGWLGWQRYEDHLGGPPVQVVLADSDGSTGDPVLDRTLVTVLRQELAQSTFVTLLSGSAVSSNLALMMHKPDDSLTVALAREVCERTGSQAVLHGTIAHAGNSFLLTEEATNCVDGASLGSARQQVSRAEELPAAVQKLGLALRHDLGESRRMIARFNGPLWPANTASLDALKAYTQCARLAQIGHFAEAKELEKQAIALDPNFADAWNDLSVLELDTGDLSAEREHMKKAYALRDRTTEPVRLYIVARYEQEVTGDLFEALRNYHSWAETYPRKPQPWSGIVETSRQLGDLKEEVVAAQRLKDLLPTNSVVYYDLAHSQMGVGDYAASRATCNLAISLHFDGDNIRQTLLRLGYLQNDPALVAEQEAWGKEHPNSPFLIGNEALYALLQGRTKDSERLFAGMAQAFRAVGTPTVADDVTSSLAAAYAQFGQSELARKYAALPPPADIADDYLMGLVYTGDTARAESLLREQLANQPQSTLWNLYMAPEVRGAILLLAHQPQQALTLLEPTRRFDGRDFGGQYLRGLAYMDLNQLPQAEAEFRAIVNHPAINVNGYQYPLSKLQLARVLAREGNKPAAAEAYGVFLESWKNADPGQPLVLTARKELEALSHVD